MGLIYDIRTSEKALDTLIQLTGIGVEIWRNFVGREREYRFDDDLVSDVIKRYGKMPESFRNWNFIFFHITTSKNDCGDLKKNGIMDLQKVCNSQSTELTKFLLSHGIKVSIKEKTLTTENIRFDISFDRDLECPPDSTEEEYRWSIGRKLYYDFCVCGFLSIWEASPYGGYVHQRPEILFDLDRLLNSSLSEEWEETHKPFEVIARIKGQYLVTEKDLLDEEITLSYLTKAYETAFGEPSESIVLFERRSSSPS